MQSALALARRALGTTWPNPAVGCVIVRDGRLIGRGVTAPGGRPHAETQAIAHAARTCPQGARGATAYVTLEPCAHHGRTPPCSEALIEAGIERVVCAISDPDPRVNGRGLNTLRSAGVQTSVGVLADQARRVNCGFLSRIERNRPHVMLKLATTLDGRIATRTGESRWITGPEARRHVHVMRARSDAVLIGAGTARTDDPMLDVRDIGLSGRKPVRIVVDGALSLPLTGRLAATARQHPVWILHRPGAPVERANALKQIGVELLECPAENGVLFMPEAMRRLAESGLTRIMCEGGGRLAASLLRDVLVDEIAAFGAGAAIGGDGTPAIQAFGISALHDAPRFALRSVETIGADTLSWWSATP